jgi:hypothetical protein
MSQMQKYAWFNLAVFAIAIIVYLILVPIMGPLTALSSFGVCGLWGFGGSLLKKKQRDGKIVWDEREDLIWKRSKRIAFSAFWGVFVLGEMIPWMIIGPGGSIPVNALPWYVFGGMGTVWVTQSLAILFYYGREASHVSE